VKRSGQNASISEDANYKNRVDIKEDFGLIIREVTMADQKTFTCMVSGEYDIFEYPVQLAIYSKNRTQCNIFILIMIEVLITKC